MPKRKTGFHEFSSSVQSYTLTMNAASSWHSSLVESILTLKSYQNNTQSRKAKGGSRNDNGSCEWYSGGSKREIYRKASWTRWSPQLTAKRYTNCTKKEQSFPRMSVLAFNLFHQIRTLSAALTITYARFQIVLSWSSHRCRVQCFQKHLQTRYRQHGVINSLSSTSPHLDFGISQWAGPHSIIDIES